MDIVFIIVVIAVILLSMTLHEAMHAFVGYWLGDDTARQQGRLTLNPVKHIDPFLTLLLPVMLALMGAPVFGGAKPVPFNPDRVRYGDWGAALVAAAGPLTNLLIAFLSFGILAVLGVFRGDLVGYILSVMITVNLGFFVFNIIPIPPLDGSRVLYALAPDFVRHGMRVIEQFGTLFIFIIVIFASSLIGVYMTAAINLILSAFGGVFGVTL